MESECSVTFVYDRSNRVLAVFQFSSSWAFEGDRVATAFNFSCSCALCWETLSACGESTDGIGLMLRLSSPLSSARTSESIPLRRSVYWLLFCFFLWWQTCLNPCLGKWPSRNGEKVGIRITEDQTAELRMKSGRCLIGRLMSKRGMQKEAFRLLMSRLWKTMDNVVFKELHENL